MLDLHKQLLLEGGWVPDHVETHRSVIYLLDPELNIVYCNAYWDDFAMANGGDKLQRKNMAGTAVLGVTPDVLRPFCRDRFARVQRTRTSWEQDYECSSAGLYRLFRMRVVSLGGDHLLVENSLRVEQEHGVDRPAASPWEHIYVTQDGMVTMCVHCRRTKRSVEFPETLPELAEAVWDWVPAYVQHPPQHVSHGICRMCYPLFFESLKT